MGRTSIAMLTMILCVVGVCYWLGLIDVIPLDWLQQILSGAGVTSFQYSVIAWMAAIFLALGTTGIIIGFITHQSIEQLAYWSVGAIMLSLLWTLLPLFQTLGTIHPAFAFFGIGIFIIISVFIIIDWTRNPST